MENVAEGVSSAIDDATALKVAKTLQGSFAKQTTGEPRKWRDVPQDERRIWLRLSRLAGRLYLQGDVAGGPGDAPAPASASIAAAERIPASPAPAKGDHRAASSTDAPRKQPPWSALLGGS